MDGYKAASLHCCTTTPQLPARTAGLLGKLERGAHQPMLNVCDVEAAAMHKPTQHNRMGCLDLSRTRTMQGHHVTWRSQSRGLSAALALSELFFSPSSQIYLSLSLQPIIRRAEICETEAK